MRRHRYLTAAVFIAPALILSCTEHAAPPPTEVVAVRGDALPADPGDAAWQRAPVYTAELLVQDVIEPRLLEPTTSAVRVQAVSNGERLAIRMAWEDPTNNDLPGAARFDDACAIQVPQVVSPDVPDPQMGEETKPVEITQWRASWQAVADGRGDTIQDLYPNALVDHYPFEAAHLERGSAAQREMELRYAPARALGNRMARRPDGPVQDLIAAGAGTLVLAEDQVSEGSGQRTATGWEVVISRPLPEGLEPGGQSVIAFAVWEGTQHEVGSRKMRSVWIPLHME